MGYLRHHLGKLLSLATIEDVGSIRKAASQLRLTQPALTRQIHVLEEITGQKLLLRSPQGVRLTARGIILSDFARRLSQEIETVEKKLHEADTQRFLRIGAFGSHSIRLWPQLIFRIKKILGPTQLSVISGDADELFEKVKCGELDCAMTIVDEKTAPSLRRAVLFNDCYGLFVSPKFGLSPQIVFESHDLDEVPFAVVRSPTCLLGDDLLKNLEKSGFHLRNILAVDTFEAAANYAREGLGIAVLPYIIAKAYLCNDNLIPVVTSAFPGNRFDAHQIELISLKSSPEKPNLRKLEKALIEFFKPGFTMA